MTTMDFSSVSATALTPTTSEVSLFKEEIASARAVADSQHFIVYSLKKLSNLRVLARPNNLQGTFKNHTTDVTACKFVNYSSNVIASSSAGEFFVWFIKKESDDTLSTQVYFSIVEPITIRSFSWFLDSKTKFPELLMLYDTTAMQFSSSSLISKYVDTTIKASVAEYGLPFERTIAPNASFTSVAEGLFAFSVDESSVVVCTARNSNAPAWKPCDGEALIALELLQDNQTSTLVAASASSVSVWRVGDKEPSRTKKIVFGTSIVQLTAAHSTVAVFTDNKQCYFVDLANGSVGAPSKFEMKFAVPREPRALCFNMMNPTLFSLLADVGSRLSITQIPIPVRQQLPPPPAMPRSTPALPPPQYSPKNTFTPTPASAATQATNAPLPSKPALTNPALPQLAQDGQIAQTLEQCAHEISELQQRLNSAFDNVSQIVTLVPQMVRKDHVSLMTLSLEAQMTELQASGAALGGSGGGSASANNNGFESHFVAELLDNVARGLVDGIVPGIREALLAELEPSLRSAVVQQLKKGQKDVFKQRVDTLLRNVAQEFIAELDRKQKAYEKTFENFGKEVRRYSEATTQRMTQTIAALEDQLLAYSQSGILEELQSLRAEVKRLREQAAGAASVSTASVNPVTILATARGLFEREGPVEGLRYLARVNHAEVTLQFLSDIAGDETLRDAALEVSDADAWISVLSHLLQATKFNQLKVALSWMDDVLSEQADLAKNAVLKASLKTFVQTWKEDAKKDADLSVKLRSIEKWVK